MVPSLSSTTTISGAGSNSGAGSAGNNKNTTNNSSNITIREWLYEKHPKQLALLDKFEIDLRLGRLATSSSSRDVGTTTTTTTTTNTDRLVLTLKTVDVVKTMIGSTRWKTPAQLIALLRGLGKELELAGGYREPAIGNVLRRTIAAVREEVLTTSTATTNPSTNTSGGSNRMDNRSSLESVLWALPQHVKKPSSGTSSINRGIPSSQDSSLSSSGQQQQNQPTKHSRSESSTSVGGGGSGGGGDILEQLAMTVCNDLLPIFFQPSRVDLKQSIMEAIQEITSDFEDLNKNINDQASHHIHSGEIILTYGKSTTVERFLKTAAGNNSSKKVRFTVIVCEGAPHYDGHAMAKALVTNEDGSSVDTNYNDSSSSSSSSWRIDTIVIPDSAIFATMARVNKVILPAHAVLANGGLVASSGSNLAVLAARQNSVPVVCLAGTFKLTPLFPHEGQDTLNDLLSPSPIVDYVAQQQQQQLQPTNSNNNNRNQRRVDIVNPLHDYIQPQHISLYVTNVGSFQPSYVYRLLSEYYHPDDWAPF
jgi:translation initiation factor eIF-2B subunit beta